MTRGNYATYVKRCPLQRHAALEAAARPQYGGFGAWFGGGG